MAEDYESGFEEGVISFGEVEIKLPIPSEVVERILSDIDVSMEDAEKRVEEALRAEVEKYRGEVFEIDPSVTIPISEERVFGVDGTYYIANSIIFDIIFVGAIGISKEKIFFDFIKTITPPSPLSNRVAQGLMTYLETKIIEFLISNNIADTIIYDGTFTSLLTSINSLYSAHTEHNRDIIWIANFVRNSNIPCIKRGKISDLFSSEKEMYRPWFSKILESEKTVAVPKRMTSTIILRRRQPELMRYYSDGSFFSMFLKPGQLVMEHVKMTDPEINKPTNLARRHAYRPPDATDVERFYDRKGFYIIYYKPKKWSHALKIEIPANDKINASLNLDSQNNLLLKTLVTINEQMITPYIREPLIKYLAHLYCQQFITGAKAFKDAILSKISKKWMKRYPNITYYASGYRTL